MDMPMGEMQTEGASMGDPMPGMTHSDHMMPPDTTRR